MSSKVKNWLPGEPGKYVTILDLKEQWMKKKQQEEEVEKKQQEEKEREEKKKMCEGLDEMKIGGEEKRVGGNRWKSGWKARSGMSGLKNVSDSEVEAREMHAGLNSWVDGGRRGVGDGGLARGLQNGKSECKEVGDVKVSGVDLANNGKAKLAGGRYRVVKRFSRGGGFVKATCSDVTENVGVDDEKSQQTEEVDSIGDEKEARTNCPCHARNENQSSGGFWVCKYVEPASGAEIGESVKGNDIMKVNMEDIVGKRNVGKEEPNLLKKHKQVRNVREERKVEKVTEDAMRVNEDLSRIVNHDVEPRETRKPRDKWKLTKEVSGEAFAKQELIEVVEKNDDLTPKLENMDVMDSTEKSEAALGIEIIEKNTDKLVVGRKGIYRRKKFVNRRHQTEWTVANDRVAYPRKFDGRTREMNYGNGGLIWVKKGEASVSNAGSKD